MSEPKQWRTKGRFHSD